MADEDLNLFLGAAREDAAQIRTVAKQIPLVQEQALHLAAFSDSLVTWFIRWSSQPSSSADGSDDHFVTLLELKRLVLTASLARISRTHGRLDSYVILRNSWIGRVEQTRIHLIGRPYPHS